MDKPAPTLPAGRFSANFKEFVSLCLDKDPRKRPSAHELLKHSWIREAQPPRSERMGSGPRGDERDTGLDRSRDANHLRGIEGMFANVGLDDRS